MLILCAGEGKRFDHTTPKQLLEVDGEALLHRTVRQLKSHGVGNIIIVANDPTIMARGVARLIPDRYPFRHVPDGKFLLPDMMATKPYWNLTGRTMFVNGDVFFTDNAWETVFHCNRELAFFGRIHSSTVIPNRATQEIFAILWRFNFNNIVEEHLRGAIETLNPNSWAEQFIFYKHIIGEPMTSHILTEQKNGRQSPYKEWKVLKENNWTVEINDWTDDFDEYKYFKIWREEYEKKRNS